MISDLETLLLSTSGYYITTRSDFLHDWQWEEKNDVLSRWVFLTPIWMSALKLPAASRKALEAVFTRRGRFHVRFEEGSLVKTEAWVEVDGVPFPPAQ